MLRISALLLTLSAAAFAQAPTVTAVVNFSSYGNQLCPGLLATVYGTNFGTTAF
jgi:succinate-acetate transporter protein